jgi:hypothetical protein
MTFIEYKDYERRVARFFKAEGINNLSDKGVETESYFSHSPCECCKRPLGGDRFDMTGYNPSDGEIYEYEICPDCRYYATYGKLDDMTMMEMSNGRNKNRNRKIKKSDGNDDDDGDVWGSDPLPFRT